MLFTNEGYHVITFVFLIPHCSLQFCLKKFCNNARGFTWLHKNIFKHKLKHKSLNIVKTSTLADSGFDISASC
jgi:hypothetical protein